MNVKIGTKNVSYTKKGVSERTLLLVHGWGGSSKSHLENLADLLSSSFTVISIDLPGFNGSDLPEPNWGVKEYGKLIVDFLQALNVKSCIYVGHSFGGALGVFIASEYPSFIDQLVLSAPSFRRTSIENKVEQKLAKLYKRMHFPQLRVLKYLYYKVFFPNSDLLKYPKLESNFRKIISEDLTPLLPKINQKTLILWGDLDTYVSISDGYILNNGIKNSKFIEYKGVGHGFSASEMPLVCKDITDFIGI